MVRPTLDELAMAWLDPALAPEGRRLGPPVSPHWHRTRVGLARHLCAIVGGTPVERLGLADIWHVQTECRQRGLSTETTNKITHHVLPALLRDCEGAGLVPAGTRDRVMRGAKKLRAEGDAVGQALTLGERNKILKAFRGHWAAPLVYFLFLTGVRIGEAAGLQQRDIDWNRQTCKIVRSRRLKEVSATKSRRSQRVFRLPRAAVAAITILRHDDDPKGYVFRGERGGPINQDSFRAKVWKPMLRKAGVRPIRIHDIRHTWATMVIEGGIAPAVAAKQFGDRSETMERVYAHLGAGSEEIDRALAAPAALELVR